MATTLPDRARALAAMSAATAPTALDRVVAYLSPVAGARRMAARASLSVFSGLAGPGGYLGARTDRRATKDWDKRHGSPDGNTLPDLHELRAGSRDLLRNTPLATGAVNTVVTSAVGTGLQPHARIDRELLGLEDEAADAWERSAERIWRAWAQSTACDITGRINFAAMQALVLRSTLASGDVFALRRYKERPGDVLGLRVQLVEADRVCNPYFGVDADRVVGGVEVDEDDRPIAYHVHQGFPGEWRIRMNGGMGLDEWIRVPAVGAETGERLVLHVFHQERPGQTRGIPFLAPVIEPLKQLDRYSEAELMAAVISAFFTVFVKTGTGEGLGEIDTTNPAAASLKAHELALAPGGIADLLPGEEIQIANPARPNPQFDPFWVAVTKQIGVALEIPHEVLLKHFDASYSAARGALQEAWRMFLTRRAWLVGAFCQPAYEWVIAEAVARGHLRAPGFFADPMVRRAWCEAEWGGPTPTQLDPVKEANAAKIRKEAGFTTIQEETTGLTGGDWERNHRQSVKEHRARLRDGLIVAAPGPEEPATVPPDREEP